MSKRTEQQNKSLWLYFTHLAEDLNAAGLDMRVVLKPEISIPWNKDNIHDHLWCPIQEAVLKRRSTTKLEKREVSEIYDILNRHLGEKFGIHVEFPSMPEGYSDTAPTQDTFKADISARIQKLKQLQHERRKTYTKKA